MITAAASEPEASEQGSMQILILLLPQRASLKRASKAADPNFVLWVEIKIFYLAHCMTVPVNFDLNLAL
jgi:hypothetical protein